MTPPPLVSAMTRTALRQAPFRRFRFRSQNAARFNVVAGKLDFFRSQFPDSEEQLGFPEMNTRR
jgi:hypothetical protein